MRFHAEQQAQVAVIQHGEGRSRPQFLIEAEVMAVEGDCGVEIGDEVADGCAAAAHQGRLAAKAAEQTGGELRSWLDRHDWQSHGVERVRNHDLPLFRRRDEAPPWP
jgi:hypothetical protein